MEQVKIVLAAGGTGGHIFPAESLALELKARGLRPVLITDDRYSQYAGNLRQFEAHTIPTRSLTGGMLKKLLGMACLGLAAVKAYILLRTIKPQVVIGFGGYPSFPTVLAAQRLGIKTIIHEQNSLMGRANQALAGRVDLVVTSFVETAGINKEAKGKVVCTGNPVRPSVVALREMPYPDLHDGGTLRILVLGGSQGATIFSKVVPQAIELLPKVIRGRLRVDQQCRPADIDEAREAYQKLGVSSDLAPFFSDIPLRLASAHLVISRAGATTIAEITVAGRPAILVPYPQAKDNHQMINANTVEDSGGGWVMPQEAFTPAALSARIEAFMKLPATLIQAAEKAQAIGRPDASTSLAQIVQQMVEAK